MLAFTETENLATIDLIVLGEVGSRKPLFENKYSKSEDVQKLLNVKPSLATIRDIFSIEISFTKNVSIVLTFFDRITSSSSHLMNILGSRSTDSCSFEVEAPSCRKTFDFKSTQYLVFKCNILLNDFYDADTHIFH